MRLDMNLRCNDEPIANLVGTYDFDKKKFVDTYLYNQRISEKTFDDLLKLTLKENFEIELGWNFDLTLDLRKQEYAYNLIYRSPQINMDVDIINDNQDKINELFEETKGFIDYYFEEFIFDRLLGNTDYNSLMSALNEIADLVVWNKQDEDIIKHMLGSEFQEKLDEIRP